MAGGMLWRRLKCDIRIIQVSGPASPKCRSAVHMGLRSRQRRLAGVTREDAYDPEANTIRTQSLEGPS
jgi:hypothetical protein